MDIALLPQHWAAILCICIMIGAIVIGIIRKLMMIYVLIVSNIIIFIITYIYYNEIVYGIENGIQAYAGLGFRAIFLTPEYFPQIYTLFTSMFIHGGFAHIFGNMIVFFFIGLPFEQRIGWKKFLIIYLITGVCGALTHSVLNLGSAVPLIGASGAIFGIMGAFAYAYPRDEIMMPIGIGIMFLTKIKVLYAVIFFAAIETFIVWVDVPDGTAHFAHLGGLVGGIILAALILKNKKVGDTAQFQTTYYDSYAPPKPIKKDFSELRKLAITSGLKEMLKKIEIETVPQVRDVWLEHFLEKTICPKCKNPLNHFDGKVWCEHCGFRTSY
jgi:membrane associated rhomboid family serine protease